MRKMTFLILGVPKKNGNEYGEISFYIGKYRALYVSITNSDLFMVTSESTSLLGCKRFVCPGLCGEQNN